MPLKRGTIGAEARIPQRPQRKLLASGLDGNRRTDFSTRLPSSSMGKAATRQNDPSTATDEREGAPPECELCDRTLLVGEVVHEFRDRDSRARGVCDLCRSAAVRHGWDFASGPTPRKRSKVGAHRPLVLSEFDVVTPGEATGTSNQLPIAGMPSVPVTHLLPTPTANSNIIQYLRGQLGAAGEDPRLHSLPADILSSIADRLGRQERELARLRKEADPARRKHEEQTLVVQSKEIQQLREAVRDRDRRVTQLDSARRAEVDPVVMCRHAIDAFNMSEHADRMARIARTLGAPDVWVQDQGLGLPRIVHVTLAWDIAWYCFRVKLDLGSGKASVHELSTGGDPSALGHDRAMRNASWRESGLVLANADPTRAVIS